MAIVPPNPQSSLLRRLAEKSSEVFSSSADTSTQTEYCADSPAKTGQRMRTTSRTKHRAMKKIILADNQSIFRAGIAKVLAAQEDVRIIAQCTDLEHLQQAATATHGAIVVFASSLVPECGPLVRLMHAHSSRAVVIAENNESPQSFTGKDVDGLVFRDVSGPTLIECMHRVASGIRYVQARSGRNLPEEMDSVGARVRMRLTPKEMEIVALIVQGYKNKQIALQLGTTEQVIKNYLRSVYDKTGVSDRLELALFTIHHRILTQTIDVPAGMRVASA
jgi:DNA-binding NarL/FixJ family response regulator